MADILISMNKATEKLWKYADEWEKTPEHFDGVNPFCVAIHAVRQTTNAPELLKEQEALPIVYQDNPYTGLPVAHCPKCGKFARQYNAVYEDETKFCPYCGQEVKWE